MLGTRKKPTTIVFLDLEGPVPSQITVLKLLYLLTAVQCGNTNVPSKNARSAFVPVEHNLKTVGFVMNVRAAPTEAVLSFSSSNVLVSGPITKSQHQFGHTPSVSKGLSQSRHFCGFIPPKDTVDSFFGNFLPFVNHLLFVLKYVFHVLQHFVYSICTDVFPLLLHLQG